MTPEEANMPIFKKPYAPNYIEFIEKMNGVIKEEWKQFLFI